MTGGNQQKITTATHDGKGGWRTQPRKPACDVKSSISNLWNQIDFGIHIAVICTNLTLDFENWWEECMGSLPALKLQEGVTIAANAIYAGYVVAPYFGEALRNIKNLLSQCGISYEDKQGSVFESYISNDKAQYLNECSDPNNVWSEWNAGKCKQPKTKARVYMLIIIPQRCFQCFDKQDPHKEHCIPGIIEWAMRVESSDEFFRRMYAPDEFSTIEEEFVRIDTMDESEEKVKAFKDFYENTYTPYIESHPGAKAMTNLHERVYSRHKEYYLHEDTPEISTAQDRNKNTEHEKRLGETHDQYDSGRDNV